MESIILISILLGTVVGSLFALTGAGGAVIGVPLLILSLPLSVAQAAPVALVAVSLSAWIGAIAGLKAGTVRYKAAALIAAAGGPMTLLGLWVAYRTPDALLTLIFSGILAYIAFIMWRGRSASGPLLPDEHGFGRAPCVIQIETGRLAWNWSCVRILALSGAGAGFLSGLLGVGGGFLVVPALSKATELSMQSVVATCLAVVALISTTTVFFAVVDGRINWAIALPFAAGAAIGMLAGRRLAPRIPGHILQKAFALIALMIALGMALTLVFRSARNL
ncbi:MAG TPA: sulfite exporter TauE/SafE family protein [Gammaproteobacteria bacterium]